MTDDTSAEAIFNRRFLAYFAVGMVVASFIYIGCITFLAVPKENQRFADTVLGFLLGTLLGTLITFFYGSSKSTQAKDAVIAGQLPSAPIAPLVPPTEPVTVKVDDSKPIAVDQVEDKP